MHVLQGLDVVCFAKMKAEFHHEIGKFECLHKAKVTKSDFAGVFGSAYLHSFTEDTIKATFSATGIYPFNPDAISEKQMKPSLPTSTKSTFPITQPSPVQAIIAAMGTHRPTSFELSPTTNSLPIPGPSHTTPASLITPSRRRRISYPDTEPDPDTPSKRLHMMYSALATTSSGSLLVSKTRMTSAYTSTAPVFEEVPELPQPNWLLLRPDPLAQASYQTQENLEQSIKELTNSLSHSQDIIRAHELIEESRQAQLVIQHAELTKLNQSLHTQENKKRDDRTILFPGGFGRHLTSVEFSRLLEEQNQRKTLKAAEKAHRKEIGEANKAAKAAVDAEWKERVTEHKRAVETWIAQCAALKAGGVRAKDLPVKPRCPTKPKPTLEALACDGEVEYTEREAGGEAEQLRGSASSDSK